MNKKTILIALAALVAAALAACAAISVYMTKTCEENKPCKMSFCLGKKKHDE